jgi:monothiol glutaredoxin
MGGRRATREPCGMTATHGGIVDRAHCFGPPGAIDIHRASVAPSGFSNARKALQALYMRIEPCENSDFRADAVGEVPDLDSGNERTIAMSGISQFIDNEVKSNDVVLFMKGTPGFPQCGFSGQLVQILDYLGIDYKGVNVLTSDEMRQGIKEYSNWPTIPQLYVKGEFVGGCDIVREMFQAGELQSLLEEKGVATKAA